MADEKFGRVGERARKRAQRSALSHDYSHNITPLLLYCNFASDLPPTFKYRHLILIVTKHLHDLDERGDNYDTNADHDAVSYYAWHA